MKDLLQVMDDWKGFIALSEVKRPENYETKLKETIDLLTNARGLPAHRAEYLLKEALTTSDFPLLFGDVLDRQVLAAYKAVAPVWKQFTRMSTVRDFRLAYRFAITGGDQYLGEVKEKGEYPASARAEKKFNLQAAKYGRQFSISWEAIINDDLGALKDTPERFAMAAVRTEHRLVTGTYAGDLGTHAAGNLYDTTPGEINASTRPLTIANLERTVADMQAFLDANGEPILNRPKFLVVPPKLEFTARQILTSAVKMWLEQGDATGAAVRPFPTTNVIAQYGLELVVDPYLAILDAAGHRDSWYLFADPRDIAALEAAHLRGHERPEICMKASDKTVIGGGEISPLEGDFESDNILYRVRLCFGKCKLDWRATFMNKVATT